MKINQDMFFSFIKNIILEKKEITEFDLIKILQENSFLPEDSLKGSYFSMFEIHFIVKNCLYKIQDEFLNKKIGVLEIDSVKSLLKPYYSNDNKITTKDSVKEYYLDFSNLENTTEENVVDMLDSFWKKFIKYSSETHGNAYKIFEIDRNTNIKEIKSKYRELVKKNHPDFGGDPIKIQEINEAYDYLYTLYNE